MSVPTVAEAKERVAEYFGFTPSSSIITNDGKVWEIPNPGLMDDDQQERWEQLQFDMEQCDQDEDGELATPHRVNGELMKPPYSVRLAIVLFGEEGYEQYKAGGGIANQVSLEWAQMNREYATITEE